MSEMSGLCPENVRILSMRFLKYYLKVKHNKGICHGQEPDILIKIVGRVVKHDNIIQNSYY